MTAWQVRATIGLDNLFTATRGNRVRNPAFTTDLTGWVAGSSATILHRPPPLGPDGGAYMRLEATSASALFTARAEQSGAHLHLTPGEVVTLRASVRRFVGARDARVAVLCRDAAGSLVATFTSATISPSAADWDSEATVTFTVPAGTVRGDVFLQMIGAGAIGDRLGWAGVSLEADSTAAPRLYSVRWSHELERTDRGWPTRSALTTATVQLVMAQASDAAEWGPLTEVFLEFMTEPGGTVVDSFAGRASFPEIEPLPEGSGAGVLVTMTVSSYLLDLASLPEGGYDYPAETVADRVNRLMGGTITLDPSIWAFDLAGRAKATSNVLDLVVETLASSLADIEFNPALPPRWVMHEVMPNLLNGGLDPVTPWTLGTLERRVFSSAPLQVRENPDAPGTYELWADPDDPDTFGLVLDANLVEFGGKWSRRLDRSTNTVTVVLSDGSHVTANNAPGVLRALANYTRETNLTDPAEALALAEYLVPEDQGPAEPSAWDPEEFTALLDHTPVGWYVPGLRDYLAVGNLTRVHHPDNQVYAVGLVTSTLLDASGDTAKVTVTIEGHRAYGPGGPTGVEIDDVPQAIDAFPSTTIDAMAHARA